MNIKLHHIGEKEKEIVDSSNNYFSLGFFNYEDAIEKIDNYIAGVIIYDHPTGYGTKVFDYISRNIPIILVTKKGEALSKFVNSFKNGFVCKNEREVENALNILIGNNIVLLDDCDKLYKYSRDFQNEKFYNVIKEGDFVERK